MTHALSIEGGVAGASKAARDRFAAALLIAALLAGILVRLSYYVAWTDPWGPHHPDEHILPLEAVALWEGVTPREVGWPASTTRLAISAGAGLEWLADQGGAAWRARHDFSAVLGTITWWIGQRYTDPAPMYRLGRAISAATGILQLIVAAWAFARWFRRSGTAAAVLVFALSPIVVAYSQYVLADIAGVLFATALVGLAARPSPGGIVAMGVLAGLAASSKFHFGLWLLTPVLAALLDRSQRPARRAAVAAAAIGAAGWVVLTLVPWFWTNPILAFKEFAGVVLVKMSGGTTGATVTGNARLIFGTVGFLVWAAPLAVVRLLRGDDLRRFFPILGPLALGAILLVAGSTVFDRYGLVLMPGLTLLAAAGWEMGFESPRARRAAFGALAVLLVVSCFDLRAYERMAGEVDVDVLAKQWILQHVPRGARVAVHDENNAFLPRSAAQLQRCISYVDSPQAYEAKWATEGITVAADAPSGMRAVVMNDERFQAFWCGRELEAQTDPGYDVVTYHSGPRFGAITERNAIDNFRRAAGRSAPVDVVVLNRQIDTGVAPSQIVKTARGARVIYRR